MGSTWVDTSQEEITVLITGFAPFRNEYPVNPSWEIARSLPSHLPPPPAKARTAKDKAKDAAATATAAPPLLPPVRLLVHPEPVKVSYQAVRSLVPQLWHVGDDDDDDDAATGRPKVDLAVHIGMAGPQPRFSVERRGHRDGYAMRDVDGEFLRDQERRLREGRDWVWAGLPTELETEADLDDVLKRWKGYCPDGANVRISEDAGRYLCDFIYFSSLAHLEKAGQKRNVVFLHVPCENTEQNYATGREVVLQLVRSLVESRLAREGKLQQPGKKGK